MDYVAYQGELMGLSAIIFAIVALMAYGLAILNAIEPAHSEWATTIWMVVAVASTFASLYCVIVWL